MNTMTRVEKTCSKENRPSNEDGDSNYYNEYRGEDEQVNGTGVGMNAMQTVIETRPVLIEDCGKCMRAQRNQSRRDVQ